MDFDGSRDSKPAWYGAGPTDEKIPEATVDQNRWALIFTGFLLLVFLIGSVLFASLFIRQKSKYDDLKSHGQSFYAVNLGWQKGSCSRSCTYRVFILYGPNVRNSFKTSDFSFTQDRFIHIYYDRSNPHRFVTAKSDIYYAIVPAVVLLLGSVLFAFLLHSRMHFRRRSLEIAANPRWQAPAIVESRQYGGRGGPVYSLCSTDGAHRLFVQVPRSFGIPMRNLVGSRVTVLGELNPDGVIFLKLPDGSLVAPVNRAEGANRFVTRRLNQGRVAADPEDTNPIS